MQPLVSIIIPTFNSKLFLEETLGSVLSQTHSYWECIIVDDGSTDATKTIATQYQEKDNRFRNYNRPENLPKGPSSARNFGLEKAKGDYVVFLDSDDLLSANCLENRLLFATNFQNFDFWIFKMNMFETVPNNNGQLFNTLPGTDDELIFYKYEFYSGRFPFAVTCSFWKRNSLAALGGFDESMCMLEDPDLHLRALKLGLQPRTAINLEPDCFYRVDKEKIKKQFNKKSQKDILKANLSFIEKNIKDNRVMLINNYKRLFNNLILSKSYYTCWKVMVIFGFKKNILPYKQFLLSLFILAYNKFGLKNFKGFGYYKLREEFNKF